MKRHWFRLYYGIDNYNISIPTSSEAMSMYSTSFDRYTMIEIAPDHPLMGLRKILIATFSLLPSNAVRVKVDVLIRIKLVDNGLAYQV